MSVRTQPGDGAAVARAHDRTSGSWQFTMGVAPYADVADRTLTQRGMTVYAE